MFNKNDKIVVVTPLLFSFVVTLGVYIFSPFKNALNYRDLAKLFGGILFFCYVITFSTQIDLEIIRNFRNADKRSKLIIGLILLSLILRTLYQIIVSN